MKRWLVLGLVLAAMAPVWAKGDKKSKKPADDDSADTSDSDDDSDKNDDDDKKPDKKTDKKAADKKAADKKTADKKKSKKGDKKADKGDSDDDDDTPDKSDKKKAGKDDSDEGDKKPDKKADKKKPDKKADKGDDDATTAGFSGDDASADETGSSKVKKSDDEVSETNGSAELAKQDLTGHDLGTKKKTNEFERDRFFVDKTDTDATSEGTLIQGSITSSSFAYSESGGQFPNMAGNNYSFSRFFTDLRLQTDFRHIRASRWEARIDARVRLVDGGPAITETGLPGTAPVNNPQSGLTGQNEYDLRELWLIRNGERTDVIIGRQFINDLAAVKIDGIRFDYASSNRLTYLGFAGLYPLRGSRSLTTDYADIKDPTTGAAISPYVGSAGFGAAYRTPQAYGAFGGVALVPVDSAQESPRIFATANGYYRVNPVLDLYHFALIDLVAASGAQITNLSGGLNYKPNQRLRLTASFNRVDTDSLNIQAQAFLDAPQTNPAVQNNLMLQRLATNQARASISAGLGHNERFELTTAVTYRNRPSFEVAPIGSNNGDEITLLEARSVDVYGSITDRVSFKDMRLGIDAIDSFGVGGASSNTVPYQRDETTAFRAFAARELDNGHGEWEAEISYASNTDSNVGAACAALTDLASCFGDSNSSVLSAGGTLYYRFNRDWFLIASAYLSKTDITVATQPADPAIIGLTGYLRFSHRF